MRHRVAPGSRTRARAGGLAACVVAEDGEDVGTAVVACGQTRSLAVHSAGDEEEPKAR